jgi:class 3 adenylate cyclase
VVDDTAANVKLLAGLLEGNGYDVSVAYSGREALDSVANNPPDLILLDIMMPDLDGYEVCRQIRKRPETALLPIVMVTALDPGDERVKGIEAGADDFLTKPINIQEMLARVRSLLRIRELHKVVEEQANSLAELNQTLEDRVEQQVETLERMSRLKRFFSPQLVDMIVSGDANDPLEPHRCNLTVAFLDLRGFTAFAETVEPEEVMDVLREFHTEAGRVIMEFEGTLERFTGDGMMVFFNDPVPIPEPEHAAVKMAVAIRDSVEVLKKQSWEKREYDLGLGIGIANGFATIGAIGFEGRSDYAAIGTVTNLAARLCGEADHGQIIVPRRVVTAVEEYFDHESVGELELKGFHRAITAFNVRGPRAR